MRKNIYFLIHREKPLIFLLAATIISVASGLASNSRYQPKGAVTLQTGVFRRWSENFIAVANSVDSTGLIAGIFLGEDSNLNPKRRAIYKTTGLAHILSASGFNCMAVGKFLQIFIQILLLTLRQRIPQRYNLEIQSLIHRHGLFIGGLLFWLWSNQSFPITRAVLTLALKSVLSLFGIFAPLSRLFFIQYCLTLIIFPKLFSSPSFQLTFAALLGIQISNQMTTPSQSGWKKYVQLNCMVAICILPVTAYFFSEVNLSSILTNFLVEIPVTIGITPFCLLAMFCLVPGLEMESAAEFFLNGAIIIGDSMTWILELLIKWMPLPIFLID